MGKETSYKMRRQGAAPDSYLGRKAVDLGLITEDQLKEALERVSDEPAIPNQPPSLAAALLSCHFLTQDQVDGLLESRPTPKRVGKYRLGLKLGQGGMGVVYEAEDRDLGRQVALKMLRITQNADLADIAADEERFVREARMCAKLPKHPNIVTVYEAGVLAGRRFIAMELIRGVQFQEWRKRKTTPMRAKIAVLRDVAQAVAHAHRHGVIHRDLKPANILLDSDGVPHVTDFGLAKQISRDEGHSLTYSGYLVGTPAYVSPEQAQGLRDVDLRTDVWALGVMLYELLTDRLPFSGSSPLDIVVKTIRDPVTPPSTNTGRRSLASPDKALEIICLKALAKVPADRYPTASAMAEDLTRWLEGRRVLATPPRPSLRGWKIGAAAAVAMLAAVLLIGAFRGSSTDSSADKSERAAQFVTQGRKLLAQQRPTDALISFGRALEEDSSSRAAAAGKKEAQERMIASATVPKNPAAGASASAEKPAETGAPSPSAPGAVLLPPDGASALAPLRGHRSGVHLIAFSRDNRNLVTGGYDHTVRLWDLARRTECKLLSEGAMPVSIAFSADDFWIAAGFLDSSLRIWDGRGVSHRTLTGHRLQVTGVGFTPDGKWLASSSADGTARLWDVVSGAQKISTDGYPKGAMCLALSRDGRSLAVGSAERLVRILELPSWETRWTLQAIHETEVRCLALSPDGKRIVSAGNDGKLILCELDSGRRKVLVGHSKPVAALAFSPDGRWIASTAHDESLRVWEARSGAQVGMFRAVTGYYGVAFSPDGETLAGGTADGLVKLWNIKALNSAK